MRRFITVIAVAAGYVAAFLIASAVVAVRVAATSGPVAQASSGMYAFGDAILFLGVFGVCALVPTGAVLFFLRRYRRFWTVLSLLGVAIALTAITATALYAFGRHAAAPSTLAALAGYSVLRILISPLLALTFALFALLSPARAPRLAFLAATLMEATASIYAGCVWFVPMYFHSL
jgi:hypothetical protein